MGLGGAAAGTYDQFHWRAGKQLTHSGQLDTSPNVWCV